jgi:DNA-directed RNA polymerase subunit RPC12/RpoP
MLPVLVVPFILLANDISFIPRKALIYLISLLSIVFIIINFSMIFWRCPRCRRSYFRWWSKINFLSDYQCRHCGLKKYEGSSIKSFNQKFGKRFG